MALIRLNFEHPKNTTFLHFPSYFTVLDLTKTQLTFVEKFVDATDKFVDGVDKFVGAADKFLGSRPIIKIAPDYYILG